LAVMCSESTWRRCHRRLIADFAEIARGVPVRHLMHDGRLAPHRQSPGVRLAADGLLGDDGGQEQLGEDRDHSGGQLALIAGSSMTNEVCFTEPSLPVNFRVMVCPA